MKQEATNPRRGIHGFMVSCFKLNGHPFSSSSRNPRRILPMMKPSRARDLFAASAALLLGSLATPARADILYVTLANNTIEKITSAGAGSVFASSGLNNPGGLAFDSAGNLYVANDSGSTIEKFTRGGLGSVFASTGLLGPINLAFDSAGNLYATDNIGIKKLTPGGAISIFAGVVLHSKQDKSVRQNRTAPAPLVCRLCGRIDQPTAAFFPQRDSFSGRRGAALGKKCSSTPRKPASILACRPCPALPHALSCFACPLSCFDRTTTSRYLLAAERVSHRALPLTVRAISTRQTSTTGRFRSSPPTASAQSLPPHWAAHAGWPLTARAISTRQSPATTRLRNSRPQAAFSRAPARSLPAAA